MDATRIARDLEAAEAILRRLRAQLPTIAKVLAEADDIGCTPRATGGLPGGRGSPIGDSDPTGDLAVSPVHARIRGAVRFLARCLRRAEKEVERGLAAVGDAVLALDPEMAERMARRAELRRHAEGPVVPACYALIGGSGAVLCPEA